MVIGILQFELLVHGSESLKDKRRVVQSVKDRLHREHMVAVAEVGALERLDVAVMALACIARDGTRVGQVLDQISAKLRALGDAELGECARQVLHGSQIEGAASAEPTEDPDLADELLRHFEDEKGGRPEDPTA
jgi:uncharacterized protein